MPKDKPADAKEQRHFWETRRQMLKSQTKYDEEKGRKDAKAELDKQKK
jgi:hypothetical protein